MNLLLRLAHIAAAMAMLSLALQAQRPDRPMNGQRPAIAKVYGRVLDSTTQKGVEFASASLLLARNDSVVGGALVEANGDFVMDKLPVGEFELKVAFLGYKTLEHAVVITPDRLEQDLGDLFMEPDAVVLKAAEVTAERAQMQLQVDRRVYNVEKDLNVRGGTGIDVMKNVPGLTVDADENVQLRNSTPQILIDGRPTTLTLDQIPADEIERVEVITNPSVVFDARSSGGIINVVLKKSTRPGYNGQVQMNVGTNGRYGGNASLNVKDGRWAWNLSGNGNFSDNQTDTRTARDLYSEELLSSTFRQEGLTDNERLHGGGRLGVEVNVSNRSTLSLSGNFRRRSWDNVDELDYIERDAAGALTSSGAQDNIGGNEGNEITAQAGFKRKTPKEGREWTTDLTWNRSRRTNSATYTTSTLGADGVPEVGGTRVQDNSGSTDGDQFTWQFDMTEPRPKGKLEFGLRNSTRLEHSLLDVFVHTDTSAAYRDSTLSNDYRITDLVNAAYVNWTRKLTQHWGLQAGLRVEQNWLDAEIVDKGLEFSYHYPDGTDNLMTALFPALYFSRKWEGTREFQVNFSRKINRPNFFQMMPFVMFSDSRNVRIGNPTLAPEFINLAEVNHLLPFKKNPRSNWLSSMFARHTDNVISSFAYPLPENNEILVSSWINGDDSWTYGWENTVRLEVSKNAQLTVGGTLQYVEIGAAGFENNGWMVNGKANFSMKLPKDWSFQVNGEYEGRRPQPQGYSIPNGGVDLSASKDFGKHWSGQVTVNDVFYTRLWGTILDTPALYQETERRREMRYVRVGVTWKFGEQDASLFRRKDRPQNQRRDPGASGGEGDF